MTSRHLAATMALVQPTGAVDRLAAQYRDHAQQDDAVGRIYGALHAVLTEPSGGSWHPRLLSAVTHLDRDGFLEWYRALNAIAIARRPRDPAEADLIAAVVAELAGAWNCVDYEAGYLVRQVEKMMGGPE